MKTKVFFLALLFPVFLNAQSVGDTIVIPTINYTQTHSPNGRDTMIMFPDDPGITYEKIIMAYNMRCKDGLVSSGSNTNLGCGEWDYKCNTYIYDSTRIDSLLSFQVSHSITHFSGDTFRYVTDAMHDQYQYLQQLVEVNTIISEDQYTIGLGSLPLNHVLQTDQNSGKSQFLYTATELGSTGMSAGDLDGISIHANNTADAEFLRIRIKETTETSLDKNAPEMEDFTEVYFADYSFATGDNRIQFYQPFIWDGTSNLVVEFSFTNSTPSGALEIEGEDAGAGLCIYTSNGTHIVNDAGYTTVPTGPFSSISEEITVSFWCYGNPDFLPANTSIVHGLDANNKRSLNVHLPWSNSGVYFDCGYESGGYDRINKVATPEELEGQWNHWAFTKNATTGDMNMYLNGVVWQSGTDKTRLIDIQDFVIGVSQNSSNNYYFGKIDELRVWSKELDETTIQEWMNGSLDNTHPDYADLVAYYQFDEGSGTIANDASVYGETAVIHDYVMWGNENGINLSRNFEASSERPNMIFLQGDYDLTITGTIVTELVEKFANSMTSYEIIPRWGTMLHDSINIVSNELVWEAGYEYVYDPDGMLIDSNEVVATEFVEITLLEYYRRYPGKVELMSFVTPYGINLDLGMEGKIWYFDVTDYVDVLKGLKRMTIELGGQRQEDMDIKFLYIVGTPPHDILDFRQIWRPASKSYQDILADRAFEPRDFLMHPDGAMFKLKSVITGHGQEGEFIPRMHQFNIDGGDHEYQWQLWTECSTIPIYPQGGTWLYDRAGWCPGEPSDLYEYDITEHVTAGQVHNLDYTIIFASGSTNYQHSQQLVTYGSPNFTIDAAIINVNRPNPTAAHQRFNPACSNPVAVIQNTGETTLTDLDIEYGVYGAEILSQSWSGSLEFLETAEVILDIPNYGFWQGSSNTFTVSISNPNGQADEYAYNNVYSLTYEDVDLVDISQTPVTIECRTNNQGYQNYYAITDIDGNVIFERDDMENTTLYIDEVTLGPGCYKLRIDDTGDNGLYFWHQPGFGSGFIRIKNNSGVPIYNFDSEFGRFAEYEFAVVDMTGTSEIPSSESAISIYPNPTRNRVNIAHQGMDNTRVVASVFNSAMVKLRETEYTVSGHDFLNSIDLSDLPSGIYFLKLSYDDKVMVKKLIRQ